MPTTRKKVIKTVYKDEESEDDGDFSDSGSDAKFSADGESSTDEEDMDCAPSSGDEFSQKSKPTNAKNTKNFGKKPKFAKTLLTKINKQNETTDISCTPFSVKDLTEADKLLPSFLNLSESDSSDDESPKVLKKSTTSSAQNTGQDSISEDDVDMEYKDVWSNNIQDDSEEIAKKTFMELEKHKSKIEETKASIENYTYNINSEKESDVKDLLAMGEEVLPEVPESVQVKKKPKFKRKKDDSDSEMEDWEEVKDSKTLPQQGIQLFVEFPEAGCRKSKKVDVEMMMKRKINRVKKEYQVYMHKVHVLCWLGHGNYVSRILNDQELMAAVLSLVPSKECYPGDRVDMKYVEQITTWYKDKLTLKQDKNEDKFKPKAPPLKILLLEQIKSRVVTTRKYLVFIFVTMLRALGLQCRVMFNFVTLPLKPPSSELCSLAIKPKAEKIVNTNKLKEEKKEKQKAGSSNSKGKIKIPQVDGNYDMSFSEDENIMQIDGNDDVPSARRTRSIKRAKANETKEDNNSDNEGISPPKIAKKRTARASPKLATRKDENKNLDGNKWAHRETKTHDTIIDEKYNASAISDTKSGNRSINRTKAKEINEDKSDNEDISRPKRAKKRTGRLSPKPVTKNDECKNIHGNKQSQSEKKPHDTIEGRSDAAAISDSKSATDVRIPSKTLTRSQKLKADSSNKLSLKKDNSPDKTTANTSTRSRAPRNNTSLLTTNIHKTLNVPEICVIDANSKAIPSKYFEETKASDNKICRLSRNRSQTENPVASENAGKVEGKGKVIPGKAKARTKSAPGTAVEKSKYFEGSKNNGTTPKRSARRIKEEFKAEDTQRVSHRDLIKAKKGKDDITEDLVSIIKTRIKDAKAESKKGLVKGKNKKESDEDSDYLPVEDIKRRNSESDDDFKPAKISPRPSTSRIDRRVLSSVSNDEPKKNKIDVWCEIFVEELEQWIAVDVIKGKVHSTGDLYNNATHPVCYIVGWDNNNYLKDLTRKYVPHWNTVTRKLRAEALWWDQAIRPLLGPKTARDKEEDEYLNRMQLEAPFPKSIADYKNHPLYALKRHLLKFEAIYPPDAAVLSFVRNEPVYARECVYTCRSRDTWLKEAKVVKLGEQPYKVVKARPKWDKLSNKLITDKPLEVFGPWQVQDYEPPTAENGIVPRNAYGNVELFKACMLPKGTAHIKLPGLNRVAKKLNIDCAPAMTGFDFNGGWSHPVYDGFVVCQEFEEVITEAWVKDQEEQERREKEKTEARVYGNWKKLIKGLMIRERLKYKYGFEEPSTSETSKKSKGPRLVVKKKS